MAKIVAFSNQKGGVGKTTTCLNLAAYLAEYGKRVLIVDMDSQGNITTGLGVSKNDPNKKSIYNVLCGEEEAKDVIIKTQIENLYLLPGHIKLVGAEIEFVYKKERERILKNALSQVEDDYDVICIDCPPSLGLLTINALTCANLVVIPIQSEFYALEGLSQLVNTIKLVIKYLNPSLKIDGVVLTMLDNRSIISREISQQIKNFFGEKVYETAIPRNVRVAEAPSHGVPISLHDPKSTGGIAYKSLAEEFLKRNFGGTF